MNSNSKGRVGKKTTIFKEDEKKLRILNHPLVHLLDNVANNVAGYLKSSYMKMCTLNNSPREEEGGKGGIAVGRYGDGDSTRNPYVVA